MTDLPIPPMDLDAQKDESAEGNIYDELESNRCPFCHIDLEPKVEDQWVRSYDGRELWLPNVKSNVCSSCGTTVYPEESLEYFEKARTGEIPDLKSRTYVPDTYDDEDADE